MQCRQISCSLQEVIGWLVLAAIVILLPNWAELGYAQREPSPEKSWKKILSAAKKEGKVVVAGPAGEATRRAVTEGFRKAFPDIVIEFFGARGDQLASRIRAERDAGIYSFDVLIQGAGTGLTLFKPMGALDPVAPALILPEVVDVKYWRNRRIEFADRDGHNLVFGVNVKIVGIYNESQVTLQDVDELNKLMNPKLKGRIVINDPAVVGAGSTVFSFLWHALGKDKAREYFRKIRDQAGAIDRDERRMVEWVVKGKYALNLASSDRTITSLLNQGLKFSILSEFKDIGAFVTSGPSGLNLFNRAPHPNAAIVFANWLLSTQGQTAWSKASGYTSRRIDVPTDHLHPAVIPRPGTKYWANYLEENLPDAELGKVLKEVFGR